MSAQFETPENIVITYRPAGFGSRFIAWLIDQLALLVIFAVVATAAIILTISRVSMWEQKLGRWQYENGLLVWGTALAAAFFAIILFNAAAFFTMEWLGGGRTLGKKIMRLRVVKTDGFTLDAVAIALRNLARIIDFGLLIPPLIFPTLLIAFVTKHRQRLGDLIAGTLVISDTIPGEAEFLKLREKLESRDLTARVFQFDRRLELSPEWLLAAEKTLARWEYLDDDQIAEIYETVIKPLAGKVQTLTPESGAVSQFLADLLTTVYHREYRRLG